MLQIVSDERDCLHHAGPAFVWDVLGVEHGLHCVLPNVAYEALVHSACARVVRRRRLRSNTEPLKCHHEHAEFQHLVVVVSLLLLDFTKFGFTQSVARFSSY